MSPVPPRRSSRKPCASSMSSPPSPICSARRNPPPGRAGVSPVGSAGPRNPTTARFMARPASPSSSSRSRRRAPQAPAHGRAHRDRSQTITISSSSSRNTSHRLVARQTTLPAHPNDWKLVCTPTAAGTRHFGLFQLATDPHGETDLAATRPEVLAPMQAALERWMDQHTESSIAEIFPQGEPE